VFDAVHYRYPNYLPEAARRLSHLESDIHKAIQGIGRGREVGENPIEHDGDH
jgi:hypothetical protein